MERGLWEKEGEESGIGGTIIVLECSTCMFTLQIKISWHSIDMIYKDD